MKDKRFVHKAKLLFWVLLFAAYSVGAAGVVIDVLADDYSELSQVAVTTVHSPEQTRRASSAQIAAMYRAQSGTPFSSLPPGSTFKVVWPDGSSEYVMIVSPASSLGAQPIQGTQSRVQGGMTVPAPDLGMGTVDVTAPRHLD
ncbi:hypothetical protein LVB77_04795 [Lysobacter sp. 5GHs7-4]|uniref:hypothetical protein n=1 Tax=Lysobacter sp. 5GHs7-4 TaxID=2904253 RepID=UPI001E6200D7|nr:hypothetical protein [Lysobacter sp. 5GHs7-4]UHQ24034.1 hypothetical protein LVB77_04795 [Lysobacter sp. 5GHs7-4]